MSLVAHVFVRLNNIPLSGCTTVYLSIHFLKGISFASKFWQLWIKPLQISIFRYLCGQKHFLLLSKLPRSIIVKSHDKSMFHLVRNWQLVLPSVCTMLHSHQQRTKVPVVPYLRQSAVAPVLDFGHSNRHVVVSYCCFAFSWRHMMWCGVKAFWFLRKVPYWLILH